MSVNLIANTDLRTADEFRVGPPGRELGDLGQQLAVPYAGPDQVHLFADRPALPSQLPAAVNPEAGGQGGDARSPERLAVTGLVRMKLQPPQSRDAIAFSRREATSSARQGESRL